MTYTMVFGLMLFMIGTIMSLVYLYFFWSKDRKKRNICMVLSVCFAVGFIIMASSMISKPQKCKYNGCNKKCAHDSQYCEYHQKVTDGDWASIFETIYGD